MEVNAIRTVTIRAKTEGVSQSAADLNKLATAQSNVATSAENMATVTDMASRRQLSAADAYRRQSERIDEVARAQARIARETTIADRALQQGIITQNEHAERLQMIQSRYNIASQATDKFAKQTGLARHELINLGRQAQDVGVSLVSGQSPFMVLAQQGSQIADVFISSGTSVRSFFGQAIEWGTKFFTSTAGIVTGIAAIGAAAVYAAYQFTSSQKTVQEAMEEGNRLLKEGTALLDLRTDAQARANLQAREQTQFEVMRAELDLRLKLNAAMEETARIAQKRFTTPTQVPGEMGEAPTAFAAKATAGFDRLTAAMERLKAAQEAGLPGFQAFNAELGRIGMAHPELAQTVEEFIKLAKQGSEVERLQQQLKAVKDGLTGSATEAQKLSIGLGQADKHADSLLRSLQQEYELLRASSEEEQNRIRARQTYDNLVKQQNVSTQKASAVAAQQLANTQRRTADEAERAQAAALANANSAEDIWRAQQAGLISWSVANDEAGKLRRSAEATAEATQVAAIAAHNIAVEAEKAANFFTALPFAYSIPLMNPYQVGKNVWEKGGRLSQFNPAGYTSTTGGGMYDLAYGAGGYDPMTGIPNAQGYQFQLNQMLGKTGDLQGTINQMLGMSLRGGSAVDKFSALSQAVDLLPESQQAGPIQSMLAQLKTAPATMESIGLIKQLNDQLERLTEATEENTSSQDRITDVLSPFYTTDPRRSYLGFRAFSEGGIMTADGMLPLHKYAVGGIADRAQVAMFGEGSTPEAFVPVPSGRIPVEMKGANQNNVSVFVRVAGNADANTVASLKKTSFQLAQETRRALGGRQ